MRGSRRLRLCLPCHRLSCVLLPVCFPCERLYWGAEIAPPPLRPNFPLPCRFPLPVFNLPRMSNDLLRCVFLLGRAAEFNVPSMCASAVSKRSRPLFARSSSAIVRRSGTRGVVRERFRIRGDGRFRDGLKHMRVLSDTSAPRPVKRRIQRKNHSLQNAVGEISGTKTINALTQTNASKTSQSGKRFSKTRLARISAASAY